MKKKEIDKKLRELGWQVSREGKKHTIWTQRDREIAVPRHAEINEHTAKAILKLAGREKS
jgi:predicted RNA binding protein YcfA (HicA-like mRNA interferase family)